MFCSSTECEEQASDKINKSHLETIIAVCALPMSAPKREVLPVEAWAICQDRRFQPAVRKQLRDYFQSPASSLLDIDRRKVNELLWEKQDLEASVEVSSKLPERITFPEVIHENRNFMFSVQKKS